MWITLYSIGFHVAFVLALPWIIWVGWRKGKMRDGLGERFGALSRPWVSEVASKGPIWIHAVSVGEAQMLPPLLSRLKQTYPEIPVVVSTNTVTGHQIAAAQADAAGAFYVTFDFPWAVLKILNTLKPRMLVIIETEIWPNLIHRTAKKGIPVVFLNGRISDRSYHRYIRVKPFLKHLFSDAAAFGMRSERDAAKVINLGATRHRVRVMGNLKFESAHQLLSSEPIKRAELGLRESDFVIVAGSTFPGEEEALLNVYSRLRDNHPELRLVLVPRHPERFEEAAKAIESAGFPIGRRSEGIPQAEEYTEDAVILIDVMGELKRIYRIADATFIGKSLGLTPAGKGGQNPLEAAAWSKPILCGPHMANFQDVFEDICRAGGMDVVETEVELELGIENLILDAEIRTQMGQAAFSVIEQSLGAADRCLELLVQVVPIHPGNTES